MLCSGMPTLLNEENKELQYLSQEQKQRSLQERDHKCKGKQLLLRSKLMLGKLGW